MIMDYYTIYPNTYLIDINVRIYYSTYKLNCIVVSILCIQFLLYTHKQV